MTAPLEGRVAVVTGAGRGLGLTITGTLLDRGARVIANYCSSRDELERLADKHPGRLDLVQGDVGEEETGRALAAAGRAAGRFDVLVHNAAITRDRPLVTMSVEDWDAVQRVNLRGAFLSTKHALRVMMRQRYGRIVYLSSVAAVMGNAGQANYAASKAGLDGLARTVSQEYGQYGVRTAVLALGIVDTGLGAAAPEAIRREKLARTLLGQVSAEEAASAVAFLAGPDADFINAAVLPMDGGIRF